MKQGEPVNELGRRLNDLLAKSDMNASQLARELGITRGWLREIRYTGKLPSRELLATMVALLEGDVNEFLILAGYEPYPTVEIEVDGTKVILFCRKENLTEAEKEEIVKQLRQALS